MEFQYSSHYYDKLSSTKLIEEEQSYQQRALVSLVDFSKIILSRPNFQRKKLLLKGATGSGKTIVGGTYIDSLFKSYNSIITIWLCARPKLAEQSKNSISTLGVRTSFMEEVVTEDFIPNHTAVFGNWEKISSSKGDKKLTRDSETQLSFENLVKATKEKGIKVVLIVDEANKNNDTKITNEVISNLDPDLILEITATPKNTSSYFEVIEMSTEEVVKSGIIKKGIKINDKEINSPDIRYYVLSESLNKLYQLEELVNQAHEELGFSWYQPLLLVQIPNNSDEILDQVEAFFAGKGLTRDNGLAVYTSKDYTDELEAISNDQSIKILIFKQAIAEGWDCPRASILTMIRDPKTHSFTVQTIGRIMRMYDRKHYPKGFEKLNFGYIYAENDTNSILNKINDEIDEKVYLSVSLKEITEVEKTNLEIFNLSKSFWKHKGEVKTIKLLPQLMGIDWQNELNLNPNITWTITHGSVNTEELEKEKVELGSTSLTKEQLSERDLRTLHLKRVSEVGIDRTIIKEIEKTLVGLSVRQKLEVMCDTDNLNKIKYHYEIVKQSFLSRLNNESLLTKWSIPNEVTVSNNTPLHNEFEEKYLYEKCYLPDNDLEVELAKKIHNSQNVIAWTKNQDNGSEAFTVAYKVDYQYRHFYVDFIIETHDQLFILDTKGSHLLDKLETQEKNNYLQEFINKIQPNHQKEIVGGIVKFKNNAFYIYQGSNLVGEANLDEKWSLLTF